MYVQLHCACRVTHQVRTMIPGVLCPRHKRDSCCACLAYASASTCSTLITVGMQVPDIDPSRLVLQTMQNIACQAAVTLCLQKMSRDHALSAVLILAKVVKCDSSPSGMTSNVRNAFPRQHCLHVLVHAVFAGR